MTNQTLLVVEDHPLISLMIQDFCQDISPTTQVHVANSIAQARELTFDPPRAIIFDLSLSDSEGQATIDQIHAVFPHTPGMIYTGLVNDACKGRAAELGYDILLKTHSHKVLIEHLRRILVRGGFKLQQVAEPGNPYQSNIAGADGGKPLTLRQVEILRLTAEGMSAKMVGQRLGLSPETVRGHFREIFRRLNVSSKTQAISVFLEAERRARFHE